MIFIGHWEARHNWTGRSTSKYGKFRTCGHADNVRTHPVLLSRARRRRTTTTIFSSFLLFQSLYHLAGRPRFALFKVQCLRSCLHQPMAMPRRIKRTANPGKCTCHPQMSLSWNTSMAPISEYRSVCVLCTCSAIEPHSLLWRTSAYRAGIIEINRNVWCGHGKR